jgi:hypothetical protein
LRKDCLKALLFLSSKLHAIIIVVDGLQGAFHNVIAEWGAGDQSQTRMWWIQLVAEPLISVCLRVVQDALHIKHGWLHNALAFRGKTVIRQFRWARAGNTVQHRAIAVVGLESV